MKKQGFLITLALSAGIPLAGALPTLIPLYSFTDGHDGTRPSGALLQASDGNLYGTAYEGGTNGIGTVFRITTTGIFTPLYSFTAPLNNTNNDGATPGAGLAQANDGNLYGTAEAGGTHDDGTVFRITTNGIFTPLYSFTDGHDGNDPQAALVQASDGNLYGTAVAGGTNGFGTVFRIATGGVLTPLYSFTDGHDGDHPTAALIQARDGDLYGTTFYGGTNGYGTVFRITTNGVFTALWSFTGGHDGSNPQAALVQASDGYLYGTATEGGTNDDGTIFRITTNGVVTPLYSFTGTNDGQYPSAGLVQARDGYLYGTAAFSGASNYGTVFRITTNGVFTLLYTFTDGHDGAYPGTALVQAGDGNLYGTAEDGGTNGDGTVFVLALSSPALNILSAGHQSILSWPAWANNYVLQSTTNLAAPNWVTVTNAISGLAVTNSLRAQFFRLANP